MKVRPIFKVTLVVALAALVLTLPGQALAASQQLRASVGLAASSNELTSATLENAVAVVNTGALNVRSGPDVSYGTVAIIYRGQVAQLLGRNAFNTWVKIRLYTGLEGWVNASLVQTSVPVASLPVVDGNTATANAVVATGNLNVRSGPGPDFSRVAVVSYGTPVIMQDRNLDGSWVRVKTPAADVGWVKSSFLQPYVPIQNLPVAGGDAAGRPGSPTATVNTAYLNVRSGPNVAYAVVTTLSYGQTVALLGRNTGGSWVQIQLANGTKGWVNASLVQTSVAVSSLPVVETTPPANTAIVGAGALNVRNGPDVSYKSFAVIYQGQKVLMLGRAATGTWAKIQLPNGAVGWVNAIYLTSSVPFQSLPVTS